MRESLLVAGVLLAACATDPNDEPVPATPLDGRINNTPWVAGGGVARAASDDGEKTIYVYPDATVTCSTFGDEPYMVAVLPWVEGVQRLGLESEATVYFYFDATIHLVFDGRIEVITAPTEVGATAPFRIRASFLDSDDDILVEGEVKVTICE